MQGLLGDSPTFPGTGNPRSREILIPSITSFILGISIALIEVFYLNKWFRNASFTAKLISKTLIYTTFLSAARVITVVCIYSWEYQVSPMDCRVQTVIMQYFPNFSFWTHMLYFMLSVLFYLFYLESSDNIGQGVLINLFSGKYHKPIEEERVFMFIDMKDSTTLAEEMGHIQYFGMLKDSFKDLSDPILESEGEIYKYVGDEIIVSWNLNHCFAKNAIDCFFEMQDVINSNKEKYIERFGVVPQFKAGIHYGMVTTGEIGTIKKEISFSGDVLNTTDRIQNLCNSYGVNLLVSGDIVHAISCENQYHFELINEVELKGKNEKVTISSVAKNQKSE